MVTARKQMNVFAKMLNFLCGRGPVPDLDIKGSIQGNKKHHYEYYFPFLHSLAPSTVYALHWSFLNLPQSLALA